MSHIAYRRVSTTDQNLSRQLADTDITFTKEYEDKVSGSTVNRPQLQAMLDYAGEGDTIHVHSIDRLARNLGDLHSLVADLTSKGITVHFHKEELVFTGDIEGTNQSPNPINKLMLNLLGSVYEFERSMIRERQREGIAKAKLRGVYKGRKKTVDDEEILTLLASGLSIRKTAEQLGVNPSTVQRAKAQPTAKLKLHLLFELEKLQQSWLSRGSTK